MELPRLQAQEAGEGDVVHRADENYILHRSGHESNRRRYTGRVAVIVAMKTIFVFSCRGQVNKASSLCLVKMKILQAKTGQACQIIEANLWLI